MGRKHRLLCGFLALSLIAAVGGCGGVAGPGPETANAGKVSAPAIEPTTPSTDPNTPVSSPATPPPSGTGTGTGEKPPAGSGGGSPGNPGPVNPTVKNPAPPATGRLSFESMERGTYSGVTEPGAVLFTSEAGWKSHWQQHASRVVPAPAAPAVDFSQSSILAVYMGERNSGGYSVQVTGTELVDGVLKVAVKETQPAPGAMVTMALTQPYHMVRLPKLPEGTKVEIVR